MNQTNDKKVVRTWSRRSTILPGLRRPHHRGAQRPQVHSGLRDGEHGGPQAGRVCGDPHLQGPLGEGGRDRGEAEISKAAIEQSFVSKDEDYGEDSSRENTRVPRRGEVPAHQPQKAQLVLDLIKGRRVEQALQTRRTSPRSASLRWSRRCCVRRCRTPTTLSQEQGLDVDVDNLYVKHGGGERRSAHEADPACPDGPRLPLPAQACRTSSSPWRRRSRPALVTDG